MNSNSKERTDYLREIAEGRTKRNFQLWTETENGYPATLIVPGAAIAQTLLDWDEPTYFEKGDELPMGLWDDLRRKVGMAITGYDFEPIEEE